MISITESLTLELINFSQTSTIKSAVAPGKLSIQVYVMTGSNALLTATEVVRWTAHWSITLICIDVLEGTGYIGAMLESKVQIYSELCVQANFFFK